MQRDEFEAWVADEQAATEDLSPIELGAKLAQENGCQSCHSIDGNTRVGPTWQGLFGSERPLEDGTMVTADEAYLLKAIIDPNAEIEKGFPANVMPRDYGERLAEEEINALIAYIESLGQ
jgi:cytochrome c oxidase subunit 2